MANGSAAMELRVLINILQSGQGLQALMGQVGQLSGALSKLQEQTEAAASTGAGKDVAADTKEVTKEVKNTSQAITALNPQVDTMATLFEKAGRSIRFLAGGFLAFQSIQFVKTIADTAARTEVLSTVLHIVGLNAGYTSVQVEDAARSVQRLGITTQTSYEALTKFLQAGLKLDLANPLARAAQDLAVLSGLDSSQTFQRLIVNIQQLDTMGLRFMGIVVSRAEADAKWAATNNVVVESMTQRQHQEALLNAVIEKARTLEGAYEAAMGNVGKQLTSLRRYYEDLRNEIGKHLLPAYSAFISELSLFLAKMQDQAQVSSANLAIGQRLGEVVRELSRRFFEAIEFLVKHRDLMWALVAAYSAYWTVVTTKKVWFFATKWVTDFNLAIEANYKATKAAIVATYEWITAIGVLEATKVATATSETARLTTAAAETAKRLAARPVYGTGTVSNITAAENLLGARPASGVGTVAPAVAKDTEAAVAAVGSTKLNTAIAGLSTRFVNLVKYIWEFVSPMKWLANAWKAFTLGIEAVTGVLFTIEGAITIVVLAFVGLIAIFLKYTGISKILVDMGKNVYAVYKELGEWIRDIFLVAWLGVGKAFEGVQAIASKMIDTVGRLLLLLDKLPGQPITRLKAAMDNTNKELVERERALNEWRKRLEIIFGVRGDVIVQGIEDVTEKISDARTAMTDAEAEYIKVSVDQSRPQGEVDKAKAKYDEARATFTSLVELKDKLFKELKQVDPGRYATQVATAEKRKWKSEFNALETEAAALEQKLKYTIRDGIPVPREFTEQQATLDKLVQYYDKLKQDTRDTLDEIAKIPVTTEEKWIEALTGINAANDKLEKARIRTIEGVRDIVAGVGPPGTLAPALKEIEEARQRAENPRELELTKDARREALAKAARYRDPLDVSADERQKAAFKNTEDQIKESLSFQLELFKTHRAEQEASEKAAYQRGSINLEDYFFRRRATIEGQGRQELAIAVNAQKSIEKELTSLYLTPEDRAGLETQRTAAENEVEKVKARNRKDREALILEEADAQFSAGKQIYDMELKTLAASDDENASRAAINQKYEDQLIAMGKQDDEQARAVSDAERLSELYADHLRLRDKALQDRLDEIQQTKELLDKSQALIDLEKARLEVRIDRGDITSAQAMYLKNELLFKQVEQDRLVLATKELDLKEKAAELGARTVEIEEALGRGEITNAQAAERLRGLRALRTEVSGLEADVIKVNAAMEQSVTQLDSYGKQIKKDFVDSFSSALEQTIVDFRKAGQAWMSFGQSIGAAIGNIIAKNIAEHLASALHIDAIMNAFFNRIPGLGNPTAYVGRDISRIDRRLTGAEGGLVSGPGTGTSDSVPAMLSSGEHIMPASKTAQFLPLLEGIRTGRILPFARGGVVQSIAFGSVIPRRYAGGGVVTTDAGASSVQTNNGPGSMVVSLHPDALNMTMREWLEQEVVRQQGRR